MPDIYAENFRHIQYISDKKQLENISDKIHLKYRKKI